MRTIDLEKKTSIGASILLLFSFTLFAMVIGLTSLVLVSHSSNAEVLGITDLNNKSASKSSTSQISTISSISSQIESIDIQTVSNIHVYSPEELATTNPITIKVDRYNGLPVGYIPSGLEDTGLVGGGELIHEAKVGLIAMFAKVEEKGWKLKINSAYRSYEDQRILYENILSSNLNIISDQALARSKTEDLASRPGFSEHQLGTAVDIGCVNCKSEADVQDMYDYLASISRDFGFKLSYPKNNIYSFRYEPWHFRFWGMNHSE